MCSRSFQRFDVISDLRDLFVGKFEVGHLGPDFDLLRIVQPLAQIFRRVVRDSCTKLFAAREMREVGTESCGSDCALDGMAVYATHLLEKSETLLRVLTRRCRSGGKLSLFPFFKFLLWLGDEQKMHPRVLRAAKLRAKTQICRGFVGLNPEMIRMPWHGCEFSPQLRHPKLVQHVNGIQS